MSPRAAARTPKADSPGVGFNIAAITMVALLVGLALAYTIDAATRNGRLPRQAPHGEPTLIRTIGGKDLEIPLSWFRYPAQQVEGFAKQVDLKLVLPLGKDGTPREIDITLLPRSSVRPSARLLDGVYLHMFAEGQLSGPPGLVGKPLKGGNGYESETVWYDPLSPDPFVAKCSAPVVAGGGSRCLRAVHLAPGIAAVYAFDSGLLDRWKAFDGQVRPMLELMGVFGP